MDFTCMPFVSIRKYTSFADAIYGKYKTEVIPNSLLLKCSRS